MKPLWKRPGLYVSILTGLMTAFFVYELYKLSVLPAAILAGIILTVVLMWVLSAICLIRKTCIWPGGSSAVCSPYAWL